MNVKNIVGINVPNIALLLLINTSLILKKHPNDVKPIIKENIIFKSKNVRVKKRLLFSILTFIVFFLLIPFTLKAFSLGLFIFTILPLGLFIYNIFSLGIFIFKIFPFGLFIYNIFSLGLFVSNNNFFH